MRILRSAYARGPEPGPRVPARHSRKCRPVIPPHSAASVVFGLAVFFGAVRLASADAVEGSKTDGRQCLAAYDVEAGSAAIVYCRHAAEDFGVMAGALPPSAEQDVAVSAEAFYLGRLAAAYRATRDEKRGYRFLLKAITLTKPRLASAAAAAQARRDQRRIVDEWAAAQKAW